MGKGEIARYKQFLLFPQCFQKAWFPGVSKGVIVWEWVNSYCLSWIPYVSIFCVSSSATVIVSPFSGLGNVQKSITRTKINGTLQRHVGGQSIYVSTEDRKSLETKDDTPPCRITDLSVKKHVLYRNMFILKFTAPGDNMDSGKGENREYVHSVALYRKYLMWLKELIIFEPWRENYHFFQPS